MNASTYVRYELIRNFRNRRFFVFSVGFPLVLYLLIATPNRHERSLSGTGISAPLYFMVGLAALGAMNAVVGGGGRIALERVLGWTRQLRLTPLRPRTYFATKVLAAYLTALVMDPLPADLPGDDVEAVPGVDPCDREDECGELRLLVVAGSVVPHVVRDGVRTIGEASSSLGQRQGGPLGFGEVRDVSPRGDREDAGVGLTRVLSIRLCMVDPPEVDGERRRLRRRRRRDG